jgi:aromatic-L-amino-acid decarboxylase
VEGLRHHVRRHVELAQQLAVWIEADERFLFALPPPLNLVCFRYRGGDDKNQALLDALNGSGKLYLTHTRLQGRLTLRFCVGQTHTELPHVQSAWRYIQDAARFLLMPPRRNYP